MASRKPVQQGDTSLLKEYALLGCLALLWGGSYPLLKIAVSEIPPTTLIAGRVAIAALFLLGIVAWRRMRFPTDAKTWRDLFLQGMITSVFAWVILAWGARFIDSALASVLNSTSPLFVFFITLIFTRHEPVGWRKLFGVALGLAGVVLIIGVDALAGLGQQVAGQAAALFGAFLYACAAIYGKRLNHLPAPVSAAACLICAASVLIPVSVVIDRPWTLAPSLRALSAALMLALFSTGLAFLIYFRLLRTLGSLAVTSQAYLRQGVGVALGVLALGETLTPVIALGVLACIIGVAAINARVR
ncbi:MAG: EamA family transporter [Alphaproteobacteria bacterium]|nr:EamA family transporter [Alphaproteobacteria bacterium]